MAIIHEILESLEEDAPVRDLRICIRAAAVWSRRLGFAYTFPFSRGIRHNESEQKPKRLSGMTAVQLAQLARSENLLEASVGVAAINSLLDPPEDITMTGNAFDLILAHGENRNVTVVGHFPFVERLHSKVRNLWVLELEPTGDDLPAEKASEAIPQSDVVVITGTSLINHTLDGLLELARGRYTILIGPSTPLSPVFFDHGVDAICGVIVGNPEAALACISEGVSFRYTEGLLRVIVTNDL